MGIFERLLRAIHRHPYWAWIFLIAYAAAATFPHEYVQYLVNLIAIRYTHKRLYQGAGLIGIFLGGLVTCIVIARLARQAQRRWIAIFWTLTGVLIWGTWRALTANNVELVHYPQYFLEGIALLAITLSPAESLAWIALFGGLDECFQYWHLMGDKLVPFDFNDVYMDLLGGAAGILFAMAFLGCKRRLGGFSYFRKPGILAILGVTVTGIALWALGLMQLYQDQAKPYWFALSRLKDPAYWVVVRANGPHLYHTLTPIEGPILILATIALYGILDRRLQIS